MSVRVLSMKKRGLGGASRRGWAGSGAELSDEDATDDAVDGGDGILRESWEGDVRCEEMFATEEIR